MLHFMALDDLRAIFFLEICSLCTLETKSVLLTQTMAYKGLYREEGGGRTVSIEGGAVLLRKGGLYCRRELTIRDDLMGQGGG